MKGNQRTRGCYGLKTNKTLKKIDPYSFNYINSDFQALSHDPPPILKATKDSKKLCPCCRAEKSR